jgi:chloramphenicol O-acetyltransferase
LLRRNDWGRFTGLDTWNILQPLQLSKRGRRIDGMHADCLLKRFGKILENLWLDF